MGYAYMSKVYSYIESNLDEFIEGLKRLLSQPTISTQNIGVRETAKLLCSMVREIGIDAKILETRGAPVVYGELNTGRDNPTVLIYGHYDVQPPDPIDAWDSPPFEPTIRNGRIYARGAGDNKGQLYAQLMGIKSYIEVVGAPRVNIKLLFEGEEETGSPNLESFIAQNKDMLSCDLVYISDGHLHESGKPIIVLGVRGILYVEISLRGARRDLHSGNWGGPAPNAAWRMIELLNTMRDPVSGRVRIEGFYDGVREPTEEERRILRSMQFDKQRMAEELGVSPASLPDPEEIAELLTLKPTLNICGIISGYVGKGMKTVIPSRATVKMDMRLVAGQDPDDIYDKLVRHVKRYAPDAEVRMLGKMKPARTPPDNEYVGIVKEAVREATGEEPMLYLSLGGSLPISAFTDILKAPTIIVPYANFDENNHAPNENIKIENFLRGIKCCASLIDKLSTKAPS